MTKGLTEAQRRYDNQEQSEGSTVRTCDYCGQEYDLQDHDHCPCRKQCPTCDEMRDVDETFYENGGGDIVCGECIIYCYCEWDNDLDPTIRLRAKELYTRNLDVPVGSFTPLDFAKAAHINYLMS